jgi:hypothetical protein
MNRSDSKATLAVGKSLAPLEPPTVIVGIPDTLWRERKNGETITFDLRYAGLFAQLVIFRGKDGADVAQLLGEAQSMIDGAPDVGIADPTQQ